VEVKQTGFNSFDAACQVSVKVKNLSDRPGKEVIQLYTGALEPEFPRPVKELKAFAKVFLEAGEEKVVTFELKWSDFACFHPDKHHWCVPEGKYGIFLASDAATVLEQREITFKSLDDSSANVALAGE